MKRSARLTRLFAEEIAVDLGTANTLIYVRGKGIVLDEPSVVCIRRGGSHNGERLFVQAVGAEAKKMLGRAPGHLEVIRPLKNGVIANFSATELMIKQFVRTVRESWWPARAPNITVCVPGCATQVERRVIKEATYGAGAARVLLIEEPMAAAIGAGLPVCDAVGSMVVDIGGGTSEIGVIALGDTVYKASVRVGGDTFDNAIINHIRRTRGVLIGEQTAEVVKRRIGSACNNRHETTMDITGRDLAEGVPRTIKISNHEVIEALADPLSQIVVAIRIALENTPPELAADIADRGISLTGGGALLQDLDQRLADETGLPVFIAENPLTCVVRGTGMAVDLLALHAFS